MAEPPNCSQILAGCLTHLAVAEKALADMRAALGETCGDAPSEPKNIKSFAAVAATNPPIPAPAQTHVAACESPPSCRELSSPRSSPEASPRKPGVPGVSCAVDQVFLTYTATEGTKENNRNPLVSGLTMDFMVDEEPPSHMSWMPIMDPKGTARTVWNTISLFCIVYETYYIPYSMAFESRHEAAAFWKFSTIANVFFMVDPVFTFFTGYKSRMGVLVMSPHRIAMRYLKTWLIPDVLAGVPWEWCSPGRTRLPTLFKMLRLLRFTRLLRSFRTTIMTKHMKMVIEESQVIAFAVGVGKILYCVFCCTHWAACCWYVVGTRSGEDATWVKTFLQPGETRGGNYLHSLYFALTTMTTVGYGDVSPQNSSERLFLVFLLLIASIVFASLMGFLTDLIGSLRTDKEAMAAKMQMLGQYMHWRNVPASIYYAVRRHMHQSWRANRGFESYELEVMEQLPPVLRKELCFHIYGRTLRAAPFLGFVWEHEACLRELSSLVTPRVLLKGDCLFRLGQRNTTVFILITGEMWLSLNESLDLLKHSNDELAPPTPYELEDLKTTDNLLHVPRSTDHEHPQDHMKHRSAIVIDRLKKWSRVLMRRRKRTDRNVYGHKGAFGAGVLLEAVAKLEDHDIRVRHAVRLVQRHWRKRCHDGPRFTRPPAQVQSTVVRAPSYFGESCLWAPFSTWGEAEVPRHAYNARCECYCEFVCVERSDIQTMIERFSPWLDERFEMFREAVLVGLGECDDEDRAMFRASKDPRANAKGEEEEAKEEKEMENDDSEAVSTPIIGPEVNPAALDPDACWPAPPEAAAAQEELEERARRESAVANASVDFLEAVGAGFLEATAGSLGGASPEVGGVPSEAETALPRQSAAPVTASAPEEQIQDLGPACAARARALYEGNIASREPVLPAPTQAPFDEGRDGIRLSPPPSPLLPASNPASFDEGRAGIRRSPPPSPLLPASNQASFDEGRAGIRLSPPPSPLLSASNQVAAVPMQFHYPTVMDAEAMGTNHNPKGLQPPAFAEGIARRASSLPGSLPGSPKLAPHFVAAPDFYIRGTLQGAAAAPSGQLSACRLSPSSSQESLHDAVGPPRSPPSRLAGRGVTQAARFAASASSSSLRSLQQPLLSPEGARRPHVAPMQAFGGGWLSGGEGQPLAVRRQASDRRPCPSASSPQLSSRPSALAPVIMRPSTPAAAPATAVFREPPL